MSPEDGRVIATDHARHQSDARVRIVDCDVHHAMRGIADLKPYLAQRWRDHIDT